MISVSRTLSKFDEYVVSWLAVPHPAASGIFTLTITALVWPSTPVAARRRLRKGLHQAFPFSKIWGIVEDQGADVVHLTTDVALKIRIVNYRGAI